MKLTLQSLNTGKLELAGIPWPREAKVVFC